MGDRRQSVRLADALGKTPPEHWASSRDMIKAEAEALFQRLNGYANDLGLLPEEIDTRYRTHLGNHPQAFSHVGLIGAAINLARASGSR